MSELVIEDLKRLRCTSLRGPSVTMANERLLGLEADDATSNALGSIVNLRVGFPSVRINGDTRIDLVEAGSSDPGSIRNFEHFCFVGESTAPAKLADELRKCGVMVVQGPVSRWGAGGQASSTYIQDPDANETEIRCY